MPNYVTNKVQAPSHVISSLLNTNGQVDFNTVASFRGINDWRSIRSDSEEAAKLVCNIPYSDNEFIASLEKASRARVDIRKMDEQGFEQFIGMVKNYREWGYLHIMDFAREVWGTKWNACSPKADIENGTCEFQTAWDCPYAVFEKLSEKFPNDEITVNFADEDIGSNCGTFVLLSGKAIKEDIAPHYSEMTDSEKEKWIEFAYKVTGREPDLDE